VLSNTLLACLVVERHHKGGGHWGILETAKQRKNHPKPQNRWKIRSKPKTTNKVRYNGDKCGIYVKWPHRAECLTLVVQKVICPVDSIIQPLNNWGLDIINRELKQVRF